MKNLIKREFTAIMTSNIGVFFALLFLVANSLILWVFEGNYNLLDAGYANLGRFFNLVAILFLFLIPALTMGSFSSEKKNRTMDLLRTRPVSDSNILQSKIISFCIYILILLLSVSVHFATIYVLGSPVGNIDIGVFLTSNFGLLLLAVVFINIGIFASGLSSNQIVAYIIALTLNIVVFWGGDFLGTLFSSGKIHSLVAQCGLKYHYNLFVLGLLNLKSLLVFVSYIVLIYLLTLLRLALIKEVIKKYTVRCLAALFVIGFAFLLMPDIRFDFTIDKRHSLNEYSKVTMKKIADEKKKVTINVYLDGELNFGFQKLRNALNDLLSDLNNYADHTLSVSYIDVSKLSIPRDEMPLYMADRQMPPITLNEIDRNGKVMQQLIYPYVEAICGSDTARISILKNIKGNTAEENLNVSIENLEYEIVDVLRLLVATESPNIAFIEGHGELPRPYVYDAEEALSKYYNVNRGQIGNDINELDNFRVVIIAGGNHKFSESEKYILDQYIMKGGRVLWLLDGAYVSYDDLKNQGESASMKNETGLDDLLFTYGVRIGGDLLQDARCISIPVHTGDLSQSVLTPWYYAPLLIPSPNHPVTKGVADVKAEFASSISVLNVAKSLQCDVLLTTSPYTKVVKVPEMIDLDVEKIQSQPNYFNDRFVPVAVSLDGSFNSAFVNRLVPDSLNTVGYKTKNTSASTRMIIASSSDIIRNELVGQGSDTQVLPMGYDRVTNFRYGNKEFIVNAVNWLSDENGVLQMKMNSRQLGLLDKTLISENRIWYAAINTIAPILFMLIIFGIIYVRRKFRYGKNKSN